MSESLRRISPVDALALCDPDEYRRLLDGFFLLLGERRLWWQRCAEADDPRWKSCLRDAIVDVATRSRCSPEWVADLLDGDDLPKTRRRIMRLARERLYE
ncbi:MAG: hypothetical protein ACYDCA_09545 [Candidatus Tyrphobacter sp.]